jgi:hypothetical protein
MKEFKRLQELAGLDEIKVEKPKSFNDLVEQMKSEGIFEMVYTYDSIEEFVADGMLNNYEDSYTDFELFSNLVKTYFTWKSKNLISVFTLNHQEINNLKLDGTYKTLHAYVNDDEDSIVILTKF